MDRLAGTTGYYSIVSRSFQRFPIVFFYSDLAHTIIARSPAGSHILRIGIPLTGVLTTLEAEVDPFLLETGSSHTKRQRRPSYPATRTLRSREKRENLSETSVVSQPRCAVGYPGSHLLEALEGLRKPCRQILNPPMPAHHAALAIDPARSQPPDDLLIRRSLFHAHLPPSHRRLIHSSAG
jgi:hypothetical protein